MDGKTMNASGMYGWISLHKDNYKNRAEEIQAQGHELAMGVVTLPRVGPIPEALIKNLYANMHDARAAALPIILKFRYGNDEEDAKTEQIIDHLEQLEPFLYDVSDVILTIHAGFIGHYGEWHSSVHNDTPEARQTIARALFEYTPPEMIISFRTPVIIAEDVFPLPPKDANRVGFHNDALWSSTSEMGTWSPKDPQSIAFQQKYLRDNCVLFGGETAALFKTNQSPSEVFKGLQDIPYSYCSGTHRDHVIDWWKSHDMFEMIRSQLKINAGKRPF